MSDEKFGILKITNQRGLHARASARFVEIAGQFDAVIRVSKDGHVVGGDSIMGLMMLAASKGSEIHVSATGPEADEALAAIKSLVEERFGEEA
ncbi:MAG: HPr family phosphocarrier protein [Rhizobiaceae bacterium]|nr:HPr family phosphocarrier protein [Rhizobiaceae bacterium]